MKLITTKQPAREKLAEGVQLMYETVGSTLGPKGRNVAIARKYNIPIVVHDGVTVAREVESKDEFIHMGIELVRQAAERTVVEVGDGTTTSVVLAHHLVQGGMKLLQKGVNPMVLRDQLNKALDQIKPEIEKIAQKVDGKEQVKHVATVSSTIPEIGELVAEAIEKIGADGQITTEEAAGEKTYLETVQGMTLNSGYTHDYLITHPERMEAVVENPIVCVFGKKVTLTNEIAPFLIIMASMSKNKTILIVGDVWGDALRAVIQNKQVGNLNALVVNVPGHANRRQKTLEDIALMTGGKVFEDEIGLSVQQLQEKIRSGAFGIAKSAVANAKSTTIIPKDLESATEDDDEGRIKAIQAAIVSKRDALRAQIKNEESIYEREILEERLAKLSTGVAVIKVGAKTEIEMREKVERVKDAIGAARSSMLEGIVPGGGVAFLKLSKAVTGDNDGANLLREVLKAPIKKLLENAGESEESIKKIVAKVEQNTNNSEGYEVNSGEIKDLIKAGVVDPARVIRLSLENAVSVAGSILTTDSLIANEFVKPRFTEE